MGAAMAKRLLAIVILACLSSMAAALMLRAQTTETYKAHLSPVPINVSMMATVAGGGSLTATLSGKRLTLSGTFEGLRSPATTAQIHHGIKGIRGPAILDVTVSKATQGTVSAALDLTPDQIAQLRNGTWYVQIQSERAPDGNLWGWLLK